MIFNRLEPLYRNKICILAVPHTQTNLTVELWIRWGCRMKKCTLAHIKLKKAAD